MLGKGLNHCFSRLKRPSHSAPPAIPHSLNDPTTSASSSSSVVFKSFNSLYVPAASESETLTQTLSSSSAAAAATAAEGSSFSSITSSSSVPGTAAANYGPCPSERELSTAIASRRFFPAAPGPSNSIVDSAAVVAVGVVGEGVAVPTYSPDPYWDFRRSMEEMVAALGLDLRVHAVHLHELLLCYLALNRKHAHKYIVGAFADLIVGLAAAENHRSDA